MASGVKSGDRRAPGKARCTKLALTTKQVRQTRNRGRVVLALVVGRPDVQVRCNQ